MKIILLIVVLAVAYLAYARASCVRPFGREYWDGTRADTGEPAGGRRCVYVGFKKPAAPAQPKSARLVSSGIFYGQNIQVIEGAPIFFRDFALTFLGATSVPGPNGAKFKMTTYRYSAKSGDETVEVLWHTGTGDRGPVPFELAGKKYQLDRGWSEGSGEYVVVIAEADRAAALKIAEAKLLEKFPSRERSGVPLELEYLEPVAGRPGQWAAKFDAENVMDASVEMVVDVNAGTVVSYQDEWA